MCNVARCNKVEGRKERVRKMGWANDSIRTMLRGYELPDIQPNRDNVGLVDGGKTIMFHEATDEWLIQAWKEISDKEEYSRFNLKNVGDCMFYIAKELLHRGIRVKDFQVYQCKCGHKYYNKTETNTCSLCGKLVCKYCGYLNHTARFDKEIKNGDFLCSDKCLAAYKTNRK